MKVKAVRLRNRIFCLVLASTVSCISLVAQSGVVVSEEPVTKAVQEWIESNIPQMMKDARMPGFSIAVVRNGETIYAEGFGARDPRRNLPVTPDTLFGIGSITKSFVAIAILQLVEEGELSLEDAVSRHLPFELGSLEQPITIHHLLTHTPGFPNLASSTVFISRGLGNDTGVPMSSAADFYRFVNGAKDEVLYAPGERFFYNNAAWRLVGHIIQRSSGIPFHRFLTERVIRPLGMNRTTMNIAELFVDPDHFVPHSQGTDGPEQSDFPYPNPEDNLEFSFLTAAGGICSSVNEMTRYINALIEMGEYPGGRLASRGAFEQMQMLQMPRPDGNYGVTGYGYGLSVTQDFLGYKLLSHGGSIRVSTARMAFIPDLKIGIVMMGNSSGMSYGQIVESVLAIMMGKDPQDVLPALQIRKRMEQLAGKYSTYQKLQNVEVVRRRGMLYLSSGSSNTPLIPEDRTYESTKFYTLSGGLRSPIEFVIENDGVIHLLIDRYVYHKSD